MLNEKQVSRRRFLKASMVVAGGVALFSSGLPQTAIAGPNREQDVVIFRLRTRDTRSCHACKQHRKFKLFISHAVADRNRAHSGCNCPITQQMLPEQDFQRLFLDTGATVVDLRHLPQPIAVGGVTSFLVDGSGSGTSVGTWAAMGVGLAAAFGIVMAGRKRILKRFTAIGKSV